MHLFGNNFLRARCCHLHEVAENIFSKMAAFGDFSVVSKDDPRETEKLLVKLISLGFQTFAVNQFFTLKKTNKSNKDINRQYPKPKEWAQMPQLQALMKNNSKIQVLSRLTVVLEENSQMHQLASDAVQAFDILSVRPANEKQFFQCCSTLEIDIISLDMTIRTPFLVKHTQVNQAIERGVHFEIVYSPAIKDATQRRHIFKNALQLVQVARGRNIIVSSEGEAEMDFRGPYDIANLSLLFGLKENRAKDAISKNVRAVVFHANARRGPGRAVVSGRSIQSLKQSVMCEDKRKADSIVSSQPACKKMKII